MTMGSGNDAKRGHAREVAIVCHDCGSIDGDRACRLHGIRQLQSIQGSQPSGLLRDREIKCDDLPGSKNCTVPLGQRLIPPPQRPSQDLNDGDHRNCEAQVTRGVSIK
jgi:hypothetical protein